MSAIAVMRSRSGPGDPTVVDAMLAASPHRGIPSGAVTVGSVALGVSDEPDLADAGLTSDGQVGVAFAGTIDNLRELASLADLGDRPPTPADAATVLLATFRRVREDLPLLLRGSYAIAVTDGTTLWTFRDHLGMGTLFYRDDRTAFYAASEAKQVVAGAGIALEPDLDVLEAIFYSEYDDGTPSALRGVRRLPKAVLMRAHPEGAHHRRYWIPERLIETARFDPGELADRFHALMGQAVSRTLGGDDVIALSGVRRVSTPQTAQLSSKD